MKNPFQTSCSFLKLIKKQLSVFSHKWEGSFSSNSQIELILCVKIISLLTTTTTTTYDNPVDLGHISYSARRTKVQNIFPKSLSRCHEGMKAFHIYITMKYLGRIHYQIAYFFTIQFLQIGNDNTRSSICWKRVASERRGSIRSKCTRTQPKIVLKIRYL